MLHRAIVQEVVSGERMLTYGATEYSHLPAAPLSHRAQLWENVYHNAPLSHPSPSLRVPLTRSQPVPTHKLPAHLIVTVTIRE